MRVVVFSDFKILGDCLTQWLSACQAVTAVKSCRLADELPSVASAFEADLVLFEIRRRTSLEEARLLSEACPGVRLVALAIPETADHVIACADAGFAGYVSTDASLVELEAVMERAVRGEFVCNPQIAAGLAREVRRRREPAREPEPLRMLTAREREVLGHVARGRSNKEIASELGVSIATVKNHLHNVFSKLRVQGRTEALARVRGEPSLIRSA